jgi:hypothetical protein
MQTTYNSISGAPPWWRRAWHTIQHSFGRHTPRAARDVVPEPYRVLDVSQHTHQECLRADATNAHLYTRRLAAQASLPPNLATSTESVAPPPLESNAIRYLRWRENNNPVSADVQARAVIALLRQGRRVYIDYQPAQAIALAADAVVAEASDSASAASHLPGQLDYKVFSDEKLRSMSKRQCRAADQRNERYFVRHERRSRRRRRTLSGILDVQSSDTSATLQSNYQRRVMLKQRDLVVSAARQAEAVTWLTDAGLVLYADYQPQNAIVQAATLQRATSSLANLPPPPPHLSIPLPQTSDPPPTWSAASAPWASSTGAIANGFKPAGCRR